MASDQLLNRASFPAVRQALLALAVAVSCSSPICEAASRSDQCFRDEADSLRFLMQGAPLAVLRALLIWHLPLPAWTYAQRVDTIHMQTCTWVSVRL